MYKKIFMILFCMTVYTLFSSGCYCADKAAGAAEVDQNVMVFLQNLEDAVERMQTCQLNKTSENWKGKKHEKKVTRFRFKKPNLMRVDVLEGKKKGNAVLLNKDGEIIGMHKWGFKKTLEPADKRLKNIRGLTFLNSSPVDKLARIKEHVLEKGCKAVVTEEEYMDKATYRLHIEHNDPDDPVTGEDVWFAKDTFLMMKNVKYEGDRKVTDVTCYDIEVDIPIEDSVFEE